MSNQKSRLKLFLENVLFYGGLSTLTKALPLITLPIITRLLPDTSSYGKADIFNVMITFGVAITVMELTVGIFREYFEKPNDKIYQKEITATGLNIILISSSVMVFIMFISRNILSIVLFKDKGYSNLIVISSIAIALGSINNIVSSSSRMKNQRKVFFFTGITFPLVGFFSTLFFIKLGYTFEALILGTLSMNLVSCIVFIVINRKDFDLKIFNSGVAKELFKIGLPLLPGALIYWIFNSFDRVMINKMLGSHELGIYAVGFKVASVSQLIYAAFAGGWSYFSFSTMKEEDQVNVNSKIFEYLGLISIISFILAYPFIKPVFNLLFEGDYTGGAVVFPYLFLSPLVLMLFQVLGNQLIIIKKTYLITISLSVGALLNIALNYGLIPKYGIKGSAFATLLSYIVSLIIIVIICLRYKMLHINKNYIYTSFLLFVWLLTSFFIDKYYGYIYMLVLVFMGLFYYKNLISDIKKMRE